MLENPILLGIRRSIRKTFRLRPGGSRLRPGGSVLRSQTRASVRLWKRHQFIPENEREVRGAGSGDAGIRVARSRAVIAGERSSRASGHRGRAVIAGERRRAIGASTSSLRPVRSVPSVRRTHGVQTEPRFPSVSFSIQPDRKAMNMPTCERRTAGPDPTLPHVAFHTGLSLGRTSFVDCSTLNRRGADGGLDG